MTVASREQLFLFMRFAVISMSESLSFISPVTYLYSVSWYVITAVCRLSAFEAF